MVESKKKMKKNILFVSPNSPFESIGGVERYLINLMDYSKKLTNVHIHLLLPTEGNNRSGTTGNVTIYYEKNLSLTNNDLKFPKEISKKAHAFTKTVEDIINMNKISIICAENFHTDLPPAYSILLNTLGIIYKIPLILQLHSFSSTDLQMELVNQLMWNKISCVSKSVAGDCFQKGTDINSLATHYLGVNTKEFIKNSKSGELKKKLCIDKESKLILTATRIILGPKTILQQKGVINSIKAFSKLSHRYPNLYLLIAIGKPPATLQVAFNHAYEMLLGYTKLHDIEEKTIIKMFSLQEMPEVYSASDLFILPSENETFGQVFIESMACSLPVIGTKVGGIPEIISDSYNGYLVPPDDASILAQRIEKLLTDDPLRKRFINAGLKTVQGKFTAEKQFSSFYQMLEDKM